MLPLNPFTDMWQSCAYLATYDFLCVMTRERTGQFGSSSSRSVGFGLAQRGLAMIRNVYWRGGLYDDIIASGSNLVDVLEDDSVALEEDDEGDGLMWAMSMDETATVASRMATEATATDRLSTIEQFSHDGSLYSDPLAPPGENPLAGRVMQRAAAYGYSLGGMACQDLGAIATPMDGLKTIALAHSARGSLSRAARFNIPIIAGTGSGDTLTPPFGPISIFSLYESLRSPIVHVTITGSPHVNSVCGNQCPAVVVPCCQGSTNMPKHMRWFNGFFQVRTCHRPLPTRNTFEL